MANTVSILLYTAIDNDSNDITICNDNDNDNGNVNMHIDNHNDELN